MVKREFASVDGRIPPQHRHLIRTGDPADAAAMRRIAEELLAQKPHRLAVPKPIVSVGSWREALPRDTPNELFAELLTPKGILYRTGSGGLPGIFTNLVRGEEVAIIEDPFAEALEGDAEAYMDEFPLEENARWCERPFPWGRCDLLFNPVTGLWEWDAAEWDDQAAHLELLHELNPVAHSEMLGIILDLEDEGHPLRLVEQPDPYHRTKLGYHHDGPGIVPRLTLDPATWGPHATPRTLVLARRDIPGFAEFNGVYRRFNPFPVDYRDYKGTMAAVEGGLIVDDIDIAIAVGKIVCDRLQKQGVASEDQVMVIKGVYGARVEKVWFGKSGKTGPNHSSWNTVKSEGDTFERLSRREDPNERMKFLIQLYFAPAPIKSLVDDPERLFPPQIIEQLLKEQQAEFKSAEQEGVDLGPRTPPPLPDATTCCGARVYFRPRDKRTGRPKVYGGYLMCRDRKNRMRLHGSDDAWMIPFVRRNHPFNLGALRRAPEHYKKVRAYEAQYQQQLAAFPQWARRRYPPFPPPTQWRNPRIGHPARGARARR